MGKPVVSTSIGCQGLSAVDGENIMIRDTPESFAEVVLQILSDSKLRSCLGDKARQTAEHMYNWDVIGSSLRTCYWNELR